MVVIAVLVAVSFGAGSWYFAGQIEQGALTVDFSEPAYDIVVDSYADGWVTLHRTNGELVDDPLRSSEVWGLAWRGGNGVLDGSPQVAAGTSVRRVLRLASGTPPAAGTPVALRRNVWPDPASAYNIPFQEVLYPCLGGAGPAWYIPGSSSTWIVMVHGINEERSESLRALGPALRADLPALIISYRNDPGAPADPSGQHQQGTTEWADLEQAVGYATAHGATHVVLFGASMGGAIVASFLEHSRFASAVSGVILDAPMLNLRATVDYRAAQYAIPGVGVPPPHLLVASAEWLAGVRYDLDWEQVDYLDDRWLHVPALVFHGTADRKAPIGASEALQLANPELVDLVRVPGADHVESWNVDPTGYQLRETAFLTCVTADPAGRSCRSQGE